MSATLIGLGVFLLTFGGALFGMHVRARLPQHHVDADSRDTVKVAIGLIATMTALVLGLVTASAKSSFDEVEGAVKRTSVDVLAMDRALARYGPETQPIRRGLADMVQQRIAMIWEPEASGASRRDPVSSGFVTQGERLADAIRALKPSDDLQRAMQAQAAAHAESLLDARWMVLSANASTVPTPFLVVLSLWLTIIFTSFGLFAPRNGTVTAALLLAAVSVGAALFLVLELESPFDGLLKSSPEPLLGALQRINQ